MPDHPDFSEFMARERDRLIATRQEMLLQRHTLEGSIDEINRELLAIEAYDAAKTGKGAAPGPAGAQRGRRAQPTRKGSRREQILTLVRNASGGLSRGEILAELDLKGDKSAEMSVSNALTALTKRNEAYREGGKYHVRDLLGPDRQQQAERPEHQEEAQQEHQEHQEHQQEHSEHQPHQPHQQHQLAEEAAK